MITIPLSAEDLTKVRIASSPLWETVGSFGVLLHHGRHTVHAPWVARARRVLPGTDLSALLAAMCVERACPDFLSPPPEASATTFGEELERLRATPPDVVLEEVEALVRVEKELFGRLDPAQERLLEIYLKDPEGSLKRLVDTLRRATTTLRSLPIGPVSRNTSRGTRLSAGRHSRSAASRPSSPTYIRR
jgi:hypothetical protein